MAGVHRRQGHVGPYKGSPKDFVFVFGLGSHGGTKQGSVTIRFMFIWGGPLSMRLCPVLAPIFLTRKAEVWREIKRLGESCGVSNGSSWICTQSWCQSPVAPAALTTQECTCHTAALLLCACGCATVRLAILWGGRSVAAASSEFSLVVLGFVTAVLIVMNGSAELLVGFVLVNLCGCVD